METELSSAITLLAAVLASLMTAVVAWLAFKKSRGRRTRVQSRDTLFDKLVLSRSLMVVTAAVTFLSALGSLFNAGILPALARTISNLLGLSPGQ
jgi:hypothetical protein